MVVVRSQPPAAPTGLGARNAISCRSINEEQVMRSLIDRVFQHGRYGNPWRAAVMTSGDIA
jgi:hypothetical protein